MYMPISSQAWGQTQEGSETRAATVKPTASDTQTG
jgi:hypothetical protein